jgi:hypothetical protein
VTFRPHPAVILVAATALTSTAAAVAGAAPVLGSQSFSRSPYAYGWGKTAPTGIYNGGDRSGLVKSIKWVGWGRPVAMGVGLASLPRRGGGYYPGLDD